MNKNKILYNSQNVYDLIKDNTEIIETDNNVIFTPSAMDIIKSKGIKIVYKKDIADNCGCSCVKDDSTEIVKQTIKILVNKTPEPAFVLYVNGCEIQGQERFGHEVGTMPEGKIPDFLVEMGKTVADSGMDFADWMRENPDGVDLLAKKYL